MIRNIAVMFALTISGCGPFTSSPDCSDTSRGISDVRATAGDIWHSLANAVERGSITSPQRLAQFVVVLSRHGELSADDLAGFDAEFPKAATSDRPLNSDDVTRLRKLGMTN